MPFITQGKTNLTYILIVVILAVIVGGGILAYQYRWLPKQERWLPKQEIKMPEVETPEEIPPEKEIPPEEKKTETPETGVVYNTFEGVFAEVENIPKSPTSDFIEESRLVTLKGKIIKETHVAPVDCITLPCDLPGEEYDIYLFQDLVNEDYKIQMEEKYLSQFSLEIGKEHIIKGKVIYLRTLLEVKVRRFEPVEVLVRQ